MLLLSFFLKTQQCNNNIFSSFAQCSIMIIISVEIKKKKERNSREKILWFKTSKWCDDGWKEEGSTKTYVILGK